jgi:hypothetical protein
MVMGTIICLALVASWVRLRSRKIQGLDGGATARIEERLSRIEQALDAVAVEVERVSEAQRFTTRLLSDKQQERVNG